ncbi:MAG: hypothetical protein ACTSUZ_00580 [Candidatus Thorarchaeota archaeon]
MLIAKKWYIDFLGLIIGIIGFVLLSEGLTMPWMAPVFYGGTSVPFFYIIPIWFLLTSIYCQEYMKLEKDSLGNISKLSGFAATGIGFLTAVSLFPIRMPWGDGAVVTDSVLGIFILILYTSALVSGLSMLLFGFLSYKMSKYDQGAHIIGSLRGLLFILIGAFGLLIGGGFIIGSATAAVPVFFEYTMIPLMYGLLILPSILGFAQSAILRRDSPISVSGSVDVTEKKPVTTKTQSVESVDDTKVLKPDTESVQCPKCGATLNLASLFPRPDGTVTCSKCFEKFVPKT